MTGRSTALGTMQVIRLVAGREIGERLRAKSYYVLTGLLVLIIIGIGVASRFAGAPDAGTLEVGASGPAADDLAAVVPAAAGTIDRDANVTPYPDADAARSALAEGEVDVVILAGERQVVFDGPVDEQVAALLQQAWSSLEVQRALVDIGLDQGQIAEALSPAPLESVALDGDAGPSGLAVLTGTLAAVLLFVSLQTFGGYVLTGVVEEKSTAVVEVLLARAGADQLLAGKVIGIGVAALLQFAVAVIAALVSLSISGVDVPPEIWAAVPMTIVWYLGGYALYSTLFALAGSLVSRQEDAQAASAPILTALIGAYAIVFFFGYDAESTASRVLSMLPPIAPLLMPMRMAAGAATAFEVVASLVLLLLATVAAWKLAGKIYERVLLQRGSRISWRDAATLVRSGD